MIYTHVLKLGGGAVRSPLDMLRLGMTSAASTARPGPAGSSLTSSRIDATPTPTSHR